MAERAVIAGVGIHKFGRFPEKSVEDLGKFAVEMALKDAGIKFKDVQAMYLANSGSMYPGIGPKTAFMFGRTTIPIVNVEAACSGGGACLRIAEMAIKTGECDIVLAVGVEKQPKGFLSPAISGYENWQAMAGLDENPMFWAARAKKHMHDFGSTVKQFGLVSVKAHKYGALNPNAMYQTPMTLEQILNSKVVCDPLTLYMFCAPNEGAAAVVLMSEKMAKQHTRKPVYLAACAHRMNPYPEIDVGNYEGWAVDKKTVTTIAAEEAYKKAGVSPADISIVELQDTDASGEVIFSEELLLFKPGEGGPAVEKGITEIGGKMPINPDGGIISKGEPVGASALGQIVEIAYQLRGTAGPRQIAGAKVGLAHVKGAMGHSCVTICTV
jgi:acetyl-CoA acetyltransferase